MDEHLTLGILGSAERNIYCLPYLHKSSVCVPPMKQCSSIWSTPPMSWPLLPELLRANATDETPPLKAQALSLVL